MINLRVMIVSAVCLAELWTPLGPVRDLRAAPSSVRQSRTNPAARRGGVRLAGRVLVDDDGPFLGLGASLFWAVWGYSHDRARLERQFELLRTHGFEFVRVLGVVGGPGWEDRTADPRVPGYDGMIAGLTDLAFQHGLRVSWTIFGDTSQAPTVATRRAIVDRFAALARGREQKILSIEIANEGWQNGFGGRLEEVGELARYLKTRTAVLVTSTSPQLPLRCGPTLTSLYPPGAADFITFHFDRNIAAPEGRWGPVRQTLRWRSALNSCAALVPIAAANSEPIGPQSSVNSEEDPLHIVTAAAATYAAGLPIYVLHTGPGVRGGGRADLARGRAAGLEQLPRVNQILQGFAALKRVLPSDLAGWDHFDLTTPGGPLQIRSSNGARFVDAAAARRNEQLVVVPFGIRGSLVLEASAPVRIEVLHPVTGTRMMQQTMIRGGRVQLPSGPEALLIIGRQQ